MLKIKICGITSAADAMAAADEGADYIGLIFASSSRRVDVEAAKVIIPRLPPSVEAVGVFRNQPLEEVRGILKAAGLRTAQLHGDEPPGFARDLGVAVIKTFETFTPRSLETLKAYDAFAFLLDIPKGAGARKQIDPEWALQAKRHGRVILAGNLTARNVGDLVRRVRPFGVDSASGTEKSPGVKDRSRIRDFIQAAREAEKDTDRIRVKTR